MPSTRDGAWEVLPSFPPGGRRGATGCFIDGKAYVDLGAYENQEAKSTITRYFVNAGSTGNDLNRGISWDCPFATLQHAINTAVPGDTIWVAAGEYRPAEDIFGNPAPSNLRTKTFYLNKPLKIYGGFEGTEDPVTFDLADRDFAQNETVLSGQVAQGGFAYHVIYAENLPGEALLDGFTVSEGKANGSTGQQKGGGFYSVNSDLTVRNCRFAENEAQDGGGAFANLGLGKPLIRDCIFENNKSFTNGGALYLEGTPRITDCLFQADTCTVLGGGAVYIRENARLERCRFEDNYSVRGGAVLTLGSPFINACTFDNNDGDWGGAIYNLGADLIVANSLFTNGHAFKGAAIYHEGNSTNDSRIVNCTFSNNSVPASNGVVHATDEESVQIFNSLFYGNNGLSIVDENNHLTVQNSIIETGCNGIGLPGCNGTGNLDVNPQLDADYTLQSGSPAINAGLNSGLAVPGHALLTDLASIARIVDGTVDIGAYEFCDPSSSAGCDIINHLDDLKKAEQFVKIYPNPSRGSVNLSFERPLTTGIPALLFSVDGKLISQFFLASGRNFFSLTFPEVPPGFYLLVIETEEGRFYKKLVRE